jgi:hypothetical protein
MNRYVSEQLMTVDEAERLSRPHTDRDPRTERPSIWAWQTVSGALAQFVSEEQVEQMMRATRK